MNDPDMAWSPDRVVSEVERNRCSVWTTCLSKPELGNEGDQKGDLQSGRWQGRKTVPQRRNSRDETDLLHNLRDKET